MRQCPLCKSTSGGDQNLIYKPFLQQRKNVSHSSGTPKPNPSHSKRVNIQLERPALHTLVHPVFRVLWVNNIGTKAVKQTVHLLGSLLVYLATNNKMCLLWVP